jgi:hypothetical protein
MKRTGEASKSASLGKVQADKGAKEREKYEDSTEDPK